LILVTTLLFGALIVALVIAHNRLSPGIVVDNQSDRDYDRLIVELPAGRVVIAPVPRERRISRSFPPQGTTGTLEYVLYRNASVAARGELDYGPEGDVFRRIRFRIDSRGNLTVLPNAIGDDAP
jgi:hypothetical protein